jgi:hypothetical protein
MGTELPRAARGHCQPHGDVRAEALSTWSQPVPRRPPRRRGAAHGVYRYPQLLARRLRVLVEEASEVLEVCRPVATLTVDRVACARDARDFDVWVRSREPLLPT